MTQERLPFFVWIAPIRALKRTHSRRRACEEALGVCRRLGLDERLHGHIIYLVLQALQLRSPDFLDEAVDLFRGRSPSG